MRLFAYIAATTAVAAPMLVLAVAKIVLDPPSPKTAIGAILFLSFALISDLKPMPMHESGKSDVSVANVFTVTAAVLLGWQYAVPIAAISIAITMLSERVHVSRVTFNVATYAITACAAALPVIVFGSADHADAARLTGYMIASALVNMAANALLVSGAISIAQGAPYHQVAAAALRRNGVVQGMCVVLAALAANLWVVESWLIVLLVGPLFTLINYQRSMQSSRAAARDARTDNLTGLGNHRAYQATLRDMIGEAERSNTSFSLALVDMDDFKQVNDVYGHPAGDDALVLLADLLAGVERAAAFRFGGDEFALLVSMDEMSTYRRMEELQQHLATIEHPAGTTTISVGIASYPEHGRSADELQHVADSALYWSKRHGKNRSCLYSPSVVRIYSPGELSREAERNARLRAARNLVSFVDARSPFTARHSEIVSTLAGEIGAQLGLDEQMLERLRFGGLLHDLGKVALPDAILSAPRTLTPEEWAMVRRHPEFGHALLDGVGIEPVDDWVLHHHERWDGNGYPGGLAGEAIPLGARIIFVADAFEAITAERPYRPAQSVETATAELWANAETQFDPEVVAALERYLAESAPAQLLALA
ncbi:MAG: bifunctional diguanylate cyclase/phosphohydrolase [Gaiellaceae bacterium]